MNDKTAFTLPGPMGPDVPFSSLHVWAWAKTQARADVCIIRYLQSLGFVLGVHCITPDEHRTLDYAIDHFHRVTPHFPGPMRLADALKPAGPDGGFYVQGHPTPGRYLLGPELVQALTGAGWIYDVTPETTYLALVNGVLWARYQQIIGSRPLVEILP